jgi:hypothetical protein
MNRTIRYRVANVLTTLGLILTFAASAEAAVIQTYTFQQGVSGYSGTRDTYVGGDNRGAEPTTTHGNAAVLNVYEREVSLNNFYRSLIGFDLSSFSPPYDISGASLTLWVSGRAGATNVPNSLYAISSANGDWTEGQATWNNKNQSLTTPWAGSPGLSTATTDYLTTALAPTQVTPTVSSSMTFTFNAAGIALIQSWIDNPLSNTGFLLRQPDGTNSIDAFHSSESGTLIFHPLLTLEVTIPPAPEPSSLLLLGLGTLFVARRRRR